MPQYSQENMSWSLFLITTLFQPRPKRDSNTTVFLRILGNFYETAFFVDSRGCFCQFDKVTVQWWPSADLLFLIKTKNVGWFLLKRFADMVRKCYLHIICRNHSNTILLINLQKTKTCPKQNTAVKAIRSDIRILIVQTGFSPLFNG